MVGDPVARSWDALQAPMQHAMQLAWESFRGGSLGIGAVVTAPSGEIVATGRNRLLEQHPGDDLLAGTSLAHAEMNALAKLRFREHEGTRLTLWTTLQPCIQCLGAIRLSSISAVHVLAPDPIFRGVEEIRHVTAFLGQRWPEYTDHDVDQWSVLSLLLPTHVAAFWGTTFDEWSAALPQLCALAAALVHDTTMIDLARSVDDVVDVAEALWPQLDQCVPEARLLAELTAEV